MYWGVCDKMQGCSATQNTQPVRRWQNMGGNRLQPRQQQPFLAIFPQEFAPAALPRFDNHPDRSHHIVQ
jgi:hypothetical protein